MDKYKAEEVNRQCQMGGGLAVKIVQSRKFFQSSWHWSSLEGGKGGTQRRSQERVPAGGNLCKGPGAGPAWGFGGTAGRGEAGAK